MSPQQLALRHNVPLSVINAQLYKGIQHELEHTKSRAAAREIVLDHLKENPRYYDKLEMVLPEDVAPRATSAVAKSANKGKQKTTKRAKARRVTFQWSGG